VAIDAVLAEFRSWLVDLASGGCQPLVAGEDRSPEVDLFTVVGQFTALRHEVNMQTRAARAAVEQNAEVLNQLAVPAPSDDSEQLRPIV
jgi:molecular chaperone GrpE